MPTRGGPDARRRARLREWAEGPGWVFAVFAVWGALVRTPRAVAGGRPTEASSVVLPRRSYASLLVRHAVTLGYLSGRHTLTAGRASRSPGRRPGSSSVGRRVSSARLGWRPRTARASAMRSSSLIVAGQSPSSQAAQPRSRWGHSRGRAAGWSTTPRPADAVLDTRGWAAFVSGRPSYDYWHVRQAFTDSHLAYVVVGDRRAEGREPAGRDACGPSWPMRPSRSPRSPSVATAEGRRPGLPLPPPELVGGAAAMMTPRHRSGTGWSGGRAGPGSPSGIAPRCRPTSTRR